MAREGLTGSRIRERRSVAGLRQADLARSLGISASYLNLIEHNRRRIGGKLLLDIARVLGVEPSMLTEGAEAALIATLREAATQANLPQAEAERADELAGRFPGWAEVLAAGHRRIASLERTVETLSDRLTHDPHLATSVHELLTTAAAIRSTAAILAEDPDLTPEWRDRFHTNIDQDSRRLADSSKALVEYLDTGQGVEDAGASPQDELEAFLSEHDFCFEAVESGVSTPEALVADAPALRSNAARHMARGILQRVADDAAQAPRAAVRRAVKELGIDPVALARQLAIPVPMVLRRLAGLPELDVGLVVCDRAGSLLFRKPAAGFVIPRFGSACALWPLFAALSQPGQVMRAPIVQLGRGRAAFDCIAVAEAVGRPGYNTAPLVQASMLVLPDAAADRANVLEVGASCAVCPREPCPGRREPSILTGGL
ncbi:short-chain fatty acyl-CoA regulator family protein [Roseobacter sinensis]|uniref:Short-chain fatty acyl-CoA regulator family protein n=1 Tax=Roseobacter sinensis TaxID=2931391 RepID=A0ABT3BKN4_9RHOB|nr:short-chain fatty acyl-CoA regulator family protein [Roseobacter sp. WL0113]MCV3274115.1 short-chain fatty acyl-CoA regulator family protein [Roseobacter sp. WL0113]